MENKLKNQTGSKVYQKVVFVIISCTVALGLAYAISKVAFDEMLNKVDKISTPNEKLKLVSRISRDILQIDQLQRAHILNKNNYTEFAKESEYILASLDTLKNLYAKDDTQSERIDSIRILLSERDKLFSSYMRVRESLVDNRAFSNQIKDISSLIQNAPKSDSTIIKTEKKTTTKVIDQAPETEDTRGFFSRLFGSKNKVAERSASVPATVHEELNVQIDTLSNTQKAATEEKIDQAIQNLENRQIQRNSNFVNHETELNIAGGILVNKMFNILHEVESEAVQQMEVENIDARNVVNQSVQRISLILLSFFLISVILIYLILSDIKKGTAYRIALENAKNEAEYHSEAKQRFLSNMSHELRTPLQSIIGYAEQFQSNYKDSEKANIIYESSEHLLQIVNEILDYNQIISGKFNFQKETIDLQKLSEETTQVMESQAERKGIKLTLETKISGNGLVVGDSFRLKQILFNLVGNAIKFTDEGEVLVQITATDYGENTDISYRIQDTGQGIPEEDIEKIFGEFEQSISSESGTHFGNGLGLSIVKNLVEAMNGEIKTKSVLGKGSIFTVNFSLPSTTAVPVELQNLSKLQSTDSFKGSVWLVDDDAFILNLCHNILDKYHITHSCFITAKDVINRPKDPSVSHILTDMRMPEINGKELYKTLRSRYGDTVKIIAFTAQALPKEREEILSLGFDGLLLKPFKEAELLSALGLSAAKAEMSAEDFFEQTLASGVDKDHIIKIFTEDTQKDLKAFYNSVVALNYKDSELLAHRMAGRTAQFGAEKIAFKLRKMEIDIRNEDLPSIQEVEELSYKLQQFILTLNKIELS